MDVVDPSTTATPRQRSPALSRKRKWRGNARSHTDRRFSISDSSLVGLRYRDTYEVPTFSGSAEVPYFHLYPCGVCRDQGDSPRGSPLAAKIRKPDLNGNANRLRL